MANDKSKKRQQLYGLLGDLPPRTGRVSFIKVAEENRNSYVLEKLLLDLNGIEPVPAYFVKPANFSGRAPAVLYNHAHGGKYEIGKEEFINGLSYLQAPPYALELTRRGYCALCIDTWAFGERRGRSEGEIFKKMLWYGQVMWGMMVFDNIRAIDYLVSREDVDASRIATLGLSMGSTMAWWTAALDERIKVCVDLCCLTDFHALIDNDGLDGHGIYYYVPSLLKYFTTSEINALISPRAHLSIAGNYDRLTPRQGLDRVDQDLKQVYANDNASDKWELKRYDTGHFESAAMRADVVAYLEKWL